MDPEADIFILHPQDLGGASSGGAESSWVPSCQQWGERWSAPRGTTIDHHSLWAALEKAWWKVLAHGHPFSLGGSTRQVGPRPQSLFFGAMGYAHGQQSLPRAPGCRGRASLKLACPWKVTQTWRCFAKVNSFFTMCPGALTVSRRDKRTGERKGGNRTEKRKKRKRENIKRTETWRKLREEKLHGGGWLVSCTGSDFSWGVITF